MSVTTWHLEIDDPAALRPPERPAPADLRIERVEDFRINRAFYEILGDEYEWTDHVGRDEEWWQGHAARVETWLARLGGEPAGYAELERQLGGDVEIAYFGVLPPFHGRGIGGHLLAHALHRGFELGTRVWVHTCSLDAPQALANYQARGMTVFKIC
jgi:ribosomal protein S18 acetylase RimI-like enzyme